MRAISSHLPLDIGRPQFPGVTRLERWIGPRVAANAGRSGVRLLPNGLDAFVARALLIDLAERTLDLQYYIVHADQTGSLVIDRLIAAADRGVRVRMLLDDWGTLEKKDELVATIDAHPNVEIRLFNPYRHRSGIRRLLELVINFARVNRRMHNKQLIADNTAVVLGGRNIGDEYFGLGEVDFQDLDVLAAGPIGQDATNSFESYWNSPFAIPIAELVKVAASGTKLEAARSALHKRVQELCNSPYAQALAGSDLATEMRAHDLHLHAAEAKLLADPPDKLTKPAGTRSDTYLGAQISPHARATQSDMLVVSPYFVPGKDGVAFFGGKQKDGVSVRVLTNSLAATDVWLVHSGYMKYRRPLLDAGVRLYELRPETRQRAGFIKGMVGSSRASLHGKTFIFDRTTVFVGSVNLDPRSLEQNTEVGVLMRCPELAAEVAELFERWASPPLAYEVRLAKGQTLEWVGSRNGQPVRFTDEPEAGFWRPLGARFFSHLPIDAFI